jgi:hypothetical protein
VIGLEPSAAVLAFLLPASFRRLHLPRSFRGGKITENQEDERGRKSVATLPMPTTQMAGK